MGGLPPTYLCVPVENEVESRGKRLKRIFVNECPHSRFSERILGKQKTSRMITKNKKAPKVSILWLNYNSSRFIDIVLKSLCSMFDIDYPNYEILIIDNNSNDNSAKIIEDFIAKTGLERNLPPTKIVKTNSNLGFTGGNYVGYKHKAKDSKYVIIINNDLIVEQSSLTSLIKYLEEHPDVAAVQGKITTWNGDKIDNCGFYFDSMYRVYARYYGYPSTKDVKQAEVSIVSGCYSVYKVEAIEKCGGLFGFILPYFGYFDDADLSLRLWRKGYKIRYVPVLAGRHKSGASFFSHPLKNYLNGRNRISSIFNLSGVRRFMAITWIIYFLSRIATYPWLSFLRDGDYRMRAKYAALILVNSLSLARKIQNIEGEDLEPRVKLRIPTMIKMIILPTYIEPIIANLINDSETYRIIV